MWQNSSRGSANLVISIYIVLSGNLRRPVHSDWKPVLQLGIFRRPSRLWNDSAAISADRRTASVNITCRRGKSTGNRRRGESAESITMLPLLSRCLPRFRSSHGQGNEHPNSEAGQTCPAFDVTYGHMVDCVNFRNESTAAHLGPTDSGPLSGVEPTFEVRRSGVGGIAGVLGDLI